jgi:SPW repeat
MRFISTRMHGMTDYLIGVLLIAAPYLFGFATGGPKQWVPIALGAGVIVYSLITDYELGAVRMIPMPAHLALDGLGGAFLAASPWLFGFQDQVFWPHLVIGLFEIGASLMTQTVPTHDARLAALRR